MALMRESCFFTEDFQLTNEGKIIKLKNQHFTIHYEITDSGKTHLWKRLSEEG